MWPSRVWLNYIGRHSTLVNVVSITRLIQDPSMLFPPACSRCTSGMPILTSLPDLLCHGLKFLRVVPAEYRDAFDPNALMPVEGDEGEDDMPPLDNVREDLLAIAAYAEDDLDLWDILCSCAIDVQSSLLGDFSTFDEKCCLYSLNVSVSSGGVFRTALLGWTLLRNIVKRWINYQRNKRQSLNSRLKWRAYAKHIRLLQNPEDSLHIWK